MHLKIPKATVGRNKRLKIVWDVFLIQKESTQQMLNLDIVNQKRACNLESW